MTKKRQKKVSVDKYKKKSELKFIPSQEIEYNLTDTDRVSIAFEIEKPSFKVRNFRVLYEIKLENNWYWIIRYDGWHNFFHKHIRLSSEEEKQQMIPQTHIRDYNKAVGWAKQDINKKWQKYRNQFINRIELEQKG